MNSAGEMTSRVFGETKTGQPVTLYTLRNSSGTQVSIMDYGATVVSLFVADREGSQADVVLGYDVFETYLEAPFYFGCIAGRFANRISQGRFQLDGKEYRLSTNDGQNTLHGGKVGFDKQLWTGEVLEGPALAVRFRLSSPAGQEGYPGTLDTVVTYTLTPDDELQIDYEATTDAPTVLNLTNHSYFNLAGEGRGLVLDHVVQIHADAITEVDAAAIPTGILAPVKGTRFDFNVPTRMGDRFEQVGEKSTGFDHNFVLRNDSAESPRGVVAIAEVYHEESGRVMTVSTDQPGVQFYTGDFLLPEPLGKGGHSYLRHAGFCLETQHFPDSPNQPHFPSTVLRPSEEFRSRTTYTFSTRPADEASKQISL